MTGGGGGGGGGGGAESTVGINSFNLRRSQVRNMGNIHLNQSMYNEQEVEYLF